MKRCSELSKDCEGWSWSTEMWYDPKHYRFERTFSKTEFYRTLKENDRKLNRHDCFCEDSVKFETIKNFSKALWIDFRAKYFDWKIFRNCGFLAEGCGV
jgi:hypothetical protein